MSAVQSLLYVNSCAKIYLVPTLVHAKEDLTKLALILKMELVGVSVMFKNLLQSQRITPVEMF